MIRNVTIVGLLMVTLAHGQVTPLVQAKYELYMVAGSTRGGTLPPGLNTTAPAYDLRADETPDGYGFDLTEDGLIVAGTCPTGTARIQNDAVVGTQTNYWHYHRLWYIDGTNVNFYAPYYKDALVKQRLGVMAFSEDANPILAILPAFPDWMVCMKNTGGYGIGNCSDTRAFFQRTDIMQEMRISAAANAIEVNGMVFASNDSGLFSYRDGKVREVSRRIRNNLSDLTNLSLTADYDNQWVIGGSSMVYDIETDKIFKYSGSAFRFTTRQYRLPDWAEFTADRIMFVIKHITGGNGALGYQIRYDDDPWEKAKTVRIPFRGDSYTVIYDSITVERLVRRLQIRVVSLSSGKGIREIRFDAEEFSVDGYRE